jgi:hypothetical protein
MKGNLLLIFLVIGIVLMGIFGLLILSLLFWAILGIGFLGSFCVAIAFTGLSTYALYKQIVKELEQINIDLKFEEDEDEF